MDYWRSTTCISSGATLLPTRGVGIVPAAQRLAGRRVAGGERLFTSFVDRFLFGSADLIFGQEPVVYFRTGLIASLEVEFVSAFADAFFKMKRLERCFLCACGCRHGITSRDYSSIGSTRLGRVQRYCFSSTTRCGRPGAFESSRSMRMFLWSSASAQRSRTV